MQPQIRRILSARVFVFFILSAGIFLRFLQIKKYDLWFDELATCQQFSFAAVSLRSYFSGIPAVSILWKNISLSPESSFYNLLVYAYSFFFAGWESARYFSCIASIAAMFIFYKICRRYLRLDSCELIGAMVLMAISPFQIWYAQEARVYAFSSLLAMAWFLCYLNLLDNKKRALYWSLFIALSILNLLTTPYAFFLIIIGVFFILAINYSVIGRRRMIVFYSGITLFSLITLLFIKKCFIFLRYVSWLAPPGMKSMLSSFSVLVQGYSATQNQHIIGIFLFAALFIFGSFKYYRQYKLRGILFPAFFILPLAITFFISRFYIPLYLDRKFIIFAPFYYLCLAKGACSIKNSVTRTLVAAAVILLLGLSLRGYYNGFMEIKKDGTDVYPGVHRRTQYTGILHTAIKGLKKGDILCTDSINSFMIAYKYFKRYRPYDDGTQVALICYPSLLYNWEQRYMKLDPKEEKVARGGKDEPLLVSFVKWRASIRPASDLSKYKNILLISIPWNKSDILRGNPGAVRDFLAQRYKMASLKKTDSLSIETFIRRNEN